MVVRLAGTRPHAARFAARERRLSLAGFPPELHRTHLFPIPTATIDTDVVFPGLNEPITFRTALLVTENAGVHAGLVFEFGGAAKGAFLYVVDDKLGVVVGGTTSGVDAAVGEIDYGTEIPVGLRLGIVLSIIPGEGRFRLWANGVRAIDGVASSGFSGGTWTGTGDGAFAAAGTDTAHPLVPAAARQAPAGFALVEPLSVFLGQFPRQIT